MLAGTPLAAVLKAKRADAVQIHPPPEFNLRDYTIMLLQIDAQIEHALMVQYLYAAYSLGGPQVPEEHRSRVRGWQEVILGIAKEEMGHLISVQNVLRLLGGPITLAREDFPYSSEFYPFPFALEPLTKASLAKYIYAEMPEDWSDPPWSDEIIAEAQQAAGGELHRVGALFATLIQIVSQRPEDGSEFFLRDSDFDASTYPFQASWDEWGRGYQGGARGRTLSDATTGAAIAATPDVIVKPLASRDDAVAALQAIAEQGEAPEPTRDNKAPSHFYRFLEIYKEWKETGAETRWRATREVPTNPTTLDDLDGDGRPGEVPRACTPITNREARLWAHLFNVRYRLLLVSVAHAYSISGALTRDGALTPRGSVVNAAFGEMYNLRAIANILVKTPLGPEGSAVAGPTFEMPYTLDLPDGEANRWRVQRDLLEASGMLLSRLWQLGDSGIPEHRGYISALMSTDEQAYKVIEAMLSDGRTA